MTVEDTLRGAYYHLENLKKLDKKNYEEVKEEFEHELNAFLSTIRSVPEHLLDDYNIKYGLNIKDKEWLKKNFKNRAVRMGDSKAVKFFDWWNAEDNRIRRDPLGNFVLTKRRISIHRRRVKLDHTKIGLIAVLRTFCRAEVRDKHGNLISEVNQEQKIQDKSDTEITVIRGFKEYRDKSAVEICILAYKMMEKFVKNAHSNF